jgi:large subunit ribosomal protein L32e
MEELIKVKKEKKARNPKFIRQDIHKKKKLDPIWRKPRGIDSKKRLMKNNRVIVKPGFGTPSILRGKDKEGLNLVKVDKISQLKELDPKKDAIVVSRKLGYNKKKDLIQELLKQNFVIHNLRDPKSYMDKRDNELKLRKEKAQKRKKVEEKKKEESKKESIEDKLSDEEKKKIEKKEIDRLLTKKF